MRAKDRLALIRAAREAIRVRQNARIARALAFPTCRICAKETPRDETLQVLHDTHFCRECILLIVDVARDKGWTK